MKAPRAKKKIGKGKLIALISVGAVGLFGGACFIVGYGLKDGWDSVLAWFSSRYAMIAYACIIVYLLVLALFLTLSKGANNG